MRFTQDWLCNHSYHEMKFQPDTRFQVFWERHLRIARACLRLTLWMGLASVTLTPQLRAQSVFDDVDECDVLAAHPADPERLADGVADGALVPRLAVKACEAAVKQNPNELRFAYQLGRAYLAANRKDNAAEQFKRAADGNYCGRLRGAGRNGGG